MKIFLTFPHLSSLKQVIKPSGDRYPSYMCRRGAALSLTIKGHKEESQQTCLPGGSDSKVSAWNAGDPGSTPGMGRSPGERNDNSLQYPCLESPMDRGAWQATVHGLTKSRMRLSDFTHFQQTGLANFPQVTLPKFPLATLPSCSLIYHTYSNE